MSRRAWYRTNQPFDVGRLPRRARRNPDFLQAQGLGTALELQAVNAIAVLEHVLRGRCKGEGSPELLASPTRRRALDIYDAFTAGGSAVKRPIGPLIEVRWREPERFAKMPKFFLLQFQPSH